MLLGKKIIDKQEKTRAIFDLGLLRSIPKSREYAFMKGVVDAGVGINCNVKMFPDDARLSGRHLKKGIDFEKIKNSIVTR